MLIKVTYEGTEFSDLTLPNNNGLIELVLNYEYDINKIGDNTFFDIANTYEQESFGDVSAILTGNSKFKIEADERINIEDLHELHKQSVTYLREKLFELDESLGNQAKDMDAPPLDEVSDKLQSCVNWFISELK